MKPPVFDGSPCRRSPSRVAVILIVLVLLPCFSLTLLTLPSCKADDQTSKAVRRSSSESAASIKDQKRVALVIGNSDYKDMPLRNPANDADDIARVLHELGFTVQTKMNANQREMEDAVREFVREIQDGDVGLFYFSGHGVQVSGENYLIPVAGLIETETDCRYKAVNAGLILGKMEESRNRTNIFILDACRNNPFRGFRSMTKGLTMMDAPVGTFIAYATAPGSVAADGTGRNSPFAKHLTQTIKKKGLGIEHVFKEVLREVRKETEGKQIPWIASSLQDDFYFNPSSVTSLSTKPSEQEMATLREAETVATLEREKREHEQELAKLREAQRIASLEKERLEKEKQELLTRISPLPTPTSPMSVSAQSSEYREKGDAYYYGRGVSKDYVEAMRLYRMAAEKGDAYAMYNLGWMYISGDGVSKDRTEATKWYRKAADKGNEYAKNQLKVLGEPDFITSSVTRLQEVSHSSSTSLMSVSVQSSEYREKGDAYYYGRGVSKDYVEAMRLYRMAAEKGDAYTMYNLGWMYISGDGVSKDRTEAIKWYRKAADKGNEYAKNQLRVLGAANY